MSAEVRDPFPDLTTISADMCPGTHTYQFTFIGQQLTVALDDLCRAVDELDDDEAPSLAADLVVWMSKQVSECLLHYVTKMVEERREERRGR